MKVSFDGMEIGATYSRHDLARLWGYESFHALARGVVTPQGDSKIILFVTEEKQTDAVPYDDCLEGGVLHWEGPNDHFGEGRLMEAKANGEEVHLFHRQRHHRDFVYSGKLEMVKCERLTDQPSRFTFRLVD